MARYLHTMYRLTDPARSRVFYEALGLRFSNELDIVRKVSSRRRNYFFSIGDQDGPQDEYVFKRVCVSQAAHTLEPFTVERWQRWFVVDFYSLAEA